MRPAALAFAFAALIAGSAAAQNECIFVEQDGLVIIEAEAIPMINHWSVQTSTSGFTGDGYIWYTGPQRSGGASNSEILEYKVLITHPGQYELRMRSRKDGATFDAENDTWVSVNGASFQKHFITGGAGIGTWNYEHMVEPHHGHFIVPKYNMNAGINTIRMSGRSPKHKIDRFHLFMSNVQDPKNPGRPATLVQGCGQEPTPTPTPPPPTEFIYNFRQSNTHGFTPFTSRDLGEAQFQVRGDGLMIRDTSPGDVSFGAWEKVLEEMVLMEGDVWAINFTITTDAPAARVGEVGAFRLRINDTTFQSSQDLTVESLGSNALIPAQGQTRNFTMFYTVPKGINGVNPLIAFDWMHVEGTGNDSTIGVVVQELRISRVGP